MLSASVKTMGLSSFSDLAPFTRACTSSEWQALFTEVKTLKDFYLRQNPLAWIVVRDTGLEPVTYPV